MSVNFLIFRFPGIAGVCCAFQERSGGAQTWKTPCDGGNISHAAGNDPARTNADRQALLASLNPLGLAAFAELNQIHGDGMIFDPSPVLPTERPVADGDGMASAHPGLGLLIKTADCQPILLADRQGRHIAAMHAGWRGNRINFPAKGVALFCERYNLKPGEIMAVRGPSLGPAHAAFTNFAEEWGEDFLPWFDTASKTMDLWTLTRHQLCEAGIPARQIYGLDLCTFTNERFFSYRRDKACGRQASLIWIVPN